MRQYAHTRFFLALILTLAVWTLTCAPALAAVVHATYTFTDFTTRALSVKRVTVTPLASSADYAGAQLSNKPLIYSAPTYYTLTNGSITISNLVCGYAYKVAFSDGYSEPVITNYFGTNIATGTVVDANDYKTTYINFVNGSIIQVWYAYLSNTNSSGTSGALTNNDTRAVTFDTSLTIGAGSAANSIHPSAGLLTFSNSILANGSYIKGHSIIGTNFVGNGASLTNLHGSNSISAGTIDTNKMDATAYAAFVGGGTTYTNNASGLPGVVLGSGIGTNMSTLATQAGLAAGSYDINTVIYGTNILFGRDSALLSRGKHLPSRAYDYLPGHGSIDFQSPNDGVTTNRMAYVESLYSSILGGIGNRITNAVLDFPGSNSVINGGYLNIIENGASCIIGNGEQNYIGAVDTSSPEGESQSSFIGGGKNNAILDGHESAIVGGNNNTNNSSEGFIGAGLRNIMESTQGFIGAGNRNKTYSSEGAFIGAGAHNFITNSFYASILGVSNIVTFSNSVTLGVNLTNANYTLMAGVGTNFFSVSPNGGVTMRGSGGDTNLLRFTSATLSRSVDTFYTNIDRRAFIQIRISTTSVGIGGEIADVRLEIDQDGNGSWEETENRFVEADPGAALATQVVLSDYLQPNARYRVVTTNSTGFCGGFVEGVRIKYF